MLLADIYYLLYCQFDFMLGLFRTVQWHKQLWQNNSCCDCHRPGHHLIPHLPCHQEEKERCAIYIFSFCLVCLFRYPSLLKQY